MKAIEERQGRTAFGNNVAGYDQSRPDYPEWVFATLRQQQVLNRGDSILEIGAGNGLATKTLLATDAATLAVIEPDHRFAPMLSALMAESNVQSQLIQEPFEAVKFPALSFDLVLAATSFHWLDPVVRVNKLAEHTKKGGAVALVWNVFQDMSRPDLFHEATQSLLANLPNSPSGVPDKLPFALDTYARTAEFTASGEFELLFYAESHWRLVLDSGGVRLLYEGFSNISQLPQEEREELLNQLESIATSQFGGEVERNMTTPLYLFRRV